jgi:hypothetical protein
MENLEKFCKLLETKQALSSHQTPEFDTMQKEDSPSHQTCGTCMKN